MSEHNITVESGSTVRLKTAGKYCDRDIVVTAEGGNGDIGDLIDGSIIEITSDVNKIRAFAFYQFTTLKSVDTPNVTRIGAYAFGYCSALTTANFPNATIIDHSAFYHCSALTTANFSNVTSIGDYAFDHCENLASIRLPATPPTLSNGNAFNVFNVDCVFYIPTGSLAAYQAATNWSFLTKNYSFVEENR